jgi:hypothetical protein
MPPMIQDHYCSERAMFWVHSLVSKVLARRTLLDLYGKACVTLYNILSTCTSISLSFHSHAVHIVRTSVRYSNLSIYSVDVSLERSPLTKPSALQHGPVVLLVGHPLKPSEDEKNSPLGYIDDTHECMSLPGVRW